MMEWRGRVEWNCGVKPSFHEKRDSIFKTVNELISLSMLYNTLLETFRKSNSTKTNYETHTLTDV